MPETQPHLTKQEHQTLVYASKGWTDQEVADVMDVSVRTVHFHLHNLRRKLKLRNKVELTLFAIREGIVDPHKQKGQGDATTPASQKTPQDIPNEAQAS